jgi:hypothetical protein
MPRTKDGTARERAAEERERRLDLRRLVEGALLLLEEQPQRQRRLLEEVAGLARDVADILRDAHEAKMSHKVRAAAVAVRGVSMLPTKLRSSILRKVAAKALD